MVFHIYEIQSEEDWSFFHDLEFQSFITTVKDSDQFTEEELQQKFKDFCEEDPLNPEDSNHKIFIICDNDSTRTGLIWICNREPFWRFKENHVWIYNLHVLPQYRKRGLAKKLMLKAEDWCVEQGLDTLALHVIDNNIPARRLYELMDYKLVETHNESCFYEKKLIVLENL
jgi:ribosomal protein S18 acetylase RimI-like enzyme